MASSLQSESQTYRFPLSGVINVTWTFTTRVRFRVVPGTRLNMRSDVVPLGKALYTNFLTPPSANGATTTYGKERILAKPRFVKQTQPIEDGPPNIKMDGNDRQQANKDNITRPTNLENTTSSANVVRTVEPQTSMFASAERLSK
ncbi:hypothetical protein Bbelb_373840 [Branchiostoma belcheri]|nr:hypothetical protein Bbelb_373840 [Branchiostoma belcheri]